jgi:hypothetical protein
MGDNVVLENSWAIGYAISTASFEGAKIYEYMQDQE